MVGELLQERFTFPQAAVESGVTERPSYDAAGFEGYSDWLQIPETQNVKFLTKLFARVYEEWRIAQGIYQSEGLAKAIYELGSRGFQFEMHLTGYFLPQELIKQVGAKLIKFNPRDRHHEANTYAIMARGRGFSDLKHKLFVGVTSQHYLMLSYRREEPVKVFLPNEIVSLGAIPPEGAVPIYTSIH